ncbi:MAG: hypothetical protein ACI92W_001675 [Paraglaciecola sp.]|jgi:hypothetical protein
MKHSLDYLGNKENLIARLKVLTIEKEPQWGSFSSRQMLNHLNRAIGCGLGYFEYPDRSNILTRTIVKALILDLLKSFPRNSFTPAVLRSSGKYDFEAEKLLLLEIIERAAQSTNDNDWLSHPYFGSMTAKEWLKLSYIHINYHLKQFGV